MSATDTVRIIDADGHVLEDLEGIAKRLPSVYRDALGERLRSRLFPPLDHFHDQPMEVRGATRGHVGLEGWLEFLAEVGVERTVLYPSIALSFGKIRDPEWAAALARAYNEWLHEAYLDQDDRLEGMALIPAQDTDAAVAELSYAVSELGMRGAMLPSHGLPMHLGSKSYWPVYECANDLDCALAAHGGCHDGFGFDDINVYAVAHAYGHPFGQLISLASLVFNGVFDRWPRLRIAFLEGGVAWLLLALERLDESYETHVPLRGEDLVDLGPEGDVGAYVEGLLAAGRVTVGCEGGERDLAYAIDRLGSSPFMYSSDFPHEVTMESCKEEIAQLRELEVAAESIDTTLGRNAERFYGLSAS